MEACISFVISLVRYHDFAGRAWAEGNGSLHRAAIRGLRRGNGLYIWAMPLVMIYLDRIRVLNKQKKKKKKNRLGAARSSPTSARRCAHAGKPAVQCTMMRPKKKKNKNESHTPRNDP